MVCPGSPIQHKEHHSTENSIRLCRGPLSPEYAQEVRDLILNPPDVTPHAKLKEALVSRTTASEQRRLQQLFSTEELGDRKPSQLLRRIYQLLGDKVTATDSSFL